MSDNRPPQQCLVEKAASDLETVAEKAHEAFIEAFREMLDDPGSFYDFTTEVAMSQAFRRLLPRELDKAAKRWEILLNTFSALEEEAFEVNSGE